MKGKPIKKTKKRVTISVQIMVTSRRKEICVIRKEHVGNPPGLASNFI